MRRIIFRGKDGRDWHHGLLAQAPGLPDDGMYISKPGAPFAFRVQPKTIGQFTGKTDIHGKKIYEGDIVQRRGGSTYKVESDERNAMFVLCPIVARYPIGFWDLEVCGERVEIIGNTIDNTEMLSPEK